MTIKKLDDGRYKVEVYLGRASSGKKIMKYGTFDKQKEAKQFELEMLQQYKGKVDVSDKIKLDAYLDQWYNTYVTANTKITTQKRYKRLITQIKERLGYIPLIELTTPMIDRMYADIKKDTTLTNGTIIKIHRVFRQAIEQAVAWGMLDKNPVQYARPPKDDIRVINAWGIEQFSLFYNNINNDLLKLPVLIAFHTGLRVGEVSALKWSDVDLDKGMLSVNYTMIHNKGGLELISPKSDSSKASVTLTESLLVELKKVKKDHNLHKLQHKINIEYVVGKLDGGPLSPNYITKAFTKELKKINAKLKDTLPVITFHGLRHTHASILYASGANSHEISKRLRHSRVSTTDDIYIHLTEDKKKDTASTFEDAIKKAAK